MPLVTDKIIYLHLPKTGGTWIRAAIQSTGIGSRNVGSYNFPDFPEGMEQSRLVFTSVRHPIGWYESYWSFKTKKGNWGVRQPERPGEHKNDFDGDCFSKSFSEFIQKAVENWPGHYWQNYVKPFTRQADEVVIHERLETDLIRVMREAGHKFDENAIYATKPQRVTSKLPVYQRRLKWPKGLKEKLMEAEREVIERFYS